MEHLQLIDDYRRIIDSSAFSHSILSLGQFASSVEHNEDGTDRTIVTLFISASCSSSRATELTDITTANMIFSMFDLLLETKDHLRGDTFRQRCLSLDVSDSSTDIEKIQEYVYRILKQIRNSVVHNIAAIKREGDMITLCYTFKSTAFRLEINASNLEKVLQLAYLLSFGATDELQKLPDRYIAGVLASVYDKMVSETVLEDDIEHAPYSLYTTERISASQREQHLDTAYEVLDNRYIEIKKINHTHAERYPIDYILTYEGKEYIVPFEVLDQDNRIPISELCNWAAKT